MWGLICSTPCEHICSLLHSAECTAAAATHTCTISLRSSELHSAAILTQTKIAAHLPPEQQLRLPYGPAALGEAVLTVLCRYFGGLSSPPELAQFPLLLPRSQRLQTLPVCSSGESPCVRGGHITWPPAIQPSDSSARLVSCSSWCHLKPAATMMGEDSRGHLYLHER